MQVGVKWRQREECRRAHRGSMSAMHVWRRCEHCGWMCQEGRGPEGTLSPPMEISPAG